MSPAQIWWLIAAMAVITYALRAVFPLLQDRLERPRWLERALRYVPAAVLAAIVTPAVLQPGSGAPIGDTAIRIAAALLAALVAWRSRSVLVTIVIGMAALWGIGWLATLLAG
jgi:branched-subunit amino acid transport protein